MATAPFINISPQSQPSATGSTIGGILGGALGTIAGNPLLGAILAQAGSVALGNLFASESPYEQATQQNLSVGQALIQQLQRQAAGQPTAATRAQQQQLQQQAKRMQQSYAASAQRAGIGGTTPARAQQGRLQSAMLESMGGIMGQAQQSAQQQLLGVYGQGLQAQAQLEAQENAAKQQFMSSLGSLMSWYRQNKSDAQAQEFMNYYKRILDLQTRALESAIPQQK